VVDDEVEASESCFEQQSRGDKEQSAMQFGFFAAREREGKERAESCHIVERND
jgi:hypothetical protein